MGAGIKKIFVVDDNEMLTMALEDYLTRKTPHEVEIFNTGEEALERLSDAPDVVVLDYHLNSENPDAADGAQILATIKNANSNIHVIMLSGSPGESSILETLANGGDHFVIKSEAAFAEITELIQSRN